MYTSIKDIKLNNQLINFINSDNESLFISGLFVSSDVIRNITSYASKFNLKAKTRSQKVIVRDQNNNDVIGILVYAYFTRR